MLLYVRYLMVDVSSRFKLMNGHWTNTQDSFELSGSQMVVPKGWDLLITARKQGKVAIVSDVDGDIKKQERASNHNNE